MHRTDQDAELPNGGIRRAAKQGWLADADFVHEQIVYVDGGLTAVI